MKVTLSKYFLFILVYGSIFLLFLKGYYPANETGILLIGFMIFMTLVYTFAGTLITDELNARRAEIYHKFEIILDQQYQTFSMVKKIHQNIAKYKDESLTLIKDFSVNLQTEINTRADQNMVGLFNYETAQLLNVILREQLTVATKYTQIAYTIATTRLLNNRLESKR